MCPFAAFTTLEDFPTTGSALATYRDISSTLLIKKKKNVLLVCGKMLWKQHVVYNIIRQRFSMASVYHKDVWDSEGNIPRNLELGAKWKLWSASCSCLFTLCGRVEWSVLQQVWWIASHWNRFAPVRSSSLRFAPVRSASRRFAPVRSDPKLS